MTKNSNRGDSAYSLGLSQDARRFAPAELGVWLGSRERYFVYSRVI